MRPALRRRSRARAHPRAPGPRAARRGGTRESVARGRPVDGLHGRRSSTRDLLPVLEQDGALGTERERDEAVLCESASSSWVLTTTRSGSTATGRAGAALRQKRPVHASQADSTAGSGTSSWQSTASCSGSTTTPSAAWHPERRRSPSRRPRPRGSRRSRWVVRHLEVEPDACLAQSGESFVGERVVADRADHRHLGAEASAGDGLVGALPREPRQRRARDRLHLAAEGARSA